MRPMYARVQKAVRFLRARTAVRPSVAVILGSGLGALASQVDGAQAIPYATIPHFPTSTVEGHASRLVFGCIQSAPVALMHGRFHYYEGYSMQELTFPTRVLRALGVTTLILTNAAGGLNLDFRVGDLMLIRDIINLMGDNPLRGPNDERLGPRFPGMRDLFSPSMMQAARAVARREGIRLRSGVYAGVSGPSYETAAEIRTLRTLGADAVGMSTVPEVLVARHAGIPNILGISCITNVEAGRPAGARKPTPVTHAAVLAAAARAERRLTALLQGVIARL
ncbi:MAG: purine-nucleoside phosphorylase [candidate division NC10 bacterium RBG_16_65_8]|nr:MAG: purine-nucleoside phosphorylase [candidate division NC10 bacterium RBG_16_65_8]